MLFSQHIWLCFTQRWTKARVISTKERHNDQTGCPPTYTCLTTTKMTHTQHRDVHQIHTNRLLSLQTHQSHHNHQFYRAHTPHTPHPCWKKTTNSQILSDSLVIHLFLPYRVPFSSQKLGYSDEFDNTRVGHAMLHGCYHCFGVFFGVWQYPGPKKHSVVNKHSGGWLPCRAHNIVPKHGNAQKYRFPCQDTHQTPSLVALPTTMLVATGGCTIGSQWSKSGLKKIFFASIGYYFFWLAVVCTIGTQWITHPSSRNTCGQ
jgi:hypothetical protein